MSDIQLLKPFNDLKLYLLTSNNLKWSFLLIFKVGNRTCTFIVYFRVVVSLMIWNYGLVLAPPMTYHFSFFFHLLGQISFFPIIIFMKNRSLTMTLLSLVIASKRFFFGALYVGSPAKTVYIFFWQIQQNHSTTLVNHFR